MYQDKFVFAQLLDVIDPYQFKKYVDRYDGEYRMRRLPCSQQLRAMLFGQLAYRESLRDIVTCLAAHEEKLYHPGFTQPIARTTLAVANEKRDWRIYRDLAMWCIEQARPMEPRSSEVRDLDLNGTVYLLDSTVIELCLSVFGWARFDAQCASIKLNMQLDLNGSVPAFFTIVPGTVNDVRFLDELTYEQGAYYCMDKGYLDYARWYAIHCAGAYFVTRARDNMRTRRLYSRSVDKTGGVLCDQVVVLRDKKSARRYPGKMRRIKYRDAETDIVYVFVTNDLTSSARTIAQVYKYRWQIELFFRWTKQHLKIKSFWGESANAVKTQLCIAICSYLILAIVKRRLHVDLDLYRMLQITSVSLFDKKPLTELYSGRQVQIDVKGDQKQIVFGGF